MSINRNSPEPAFARAKTGFLGNSLKNSLLDLTGNMKRPYSQKVFQPGQCTPENFLDSVSMKVDMSAIYETIEVAFMDPNHRLIGVLLEIKSEAIRAHHGGQYLLQIWSFDNQLRREWPLNFRPRMWVADSVLIFSIQVGEGEDRRNRTWYYDLIDDRNDCIEFKDEFLYATGSKHSLIVADQKKMNIYKVFQGRSDSIYEYEPGTKIQGLIPTEWSGKFDADHTWKHAIFTLITETATDKQLMFNEFNMNLQSDCEFNEPITCLTNYVPRNEEVKAEITDVTTFFSNKKQYTFAQRSDHCVDVYIDNDRITLVEDIDKITYDDQVLFFQSHATKEFFQINISEHSTFSVAQAEPVDNEFFNFDKAKLNSQLLYANIFSSVNLVGKYIFVTHGKIISKYNLLTKAWIAHMQMPFKIKNCFNVQTTNTSEDNFELAAQLDDNSIHTNIISSFYEKQQEFESAAEFLENVVDFENEEGKVEFDADDKKIRVFPDHQTGEFYLVHNPKSNELWYVSKGKQIAIKGLGEDLDERDTIILVQPHVETPYIILQENKNEFALWRLELTDGEEEDDDKTYQATLVSQASFFSPTIELQSLNSAVMFEEYESVLLADSQSFFKFKLRKEKNPDIKAFEDEDNDGEIELFYQHNVRAIFAKDQEYFYALSRGTDTIKEGLSLYEASTLFSSDKIGIKSFFLSECQVSKAAIIDYNLQDMRMSYMKDLHVLEIIPQLHENVVQPFALPKRADIVAIRRVDDLLIALTFRGMVYTWDITCGKLRKMNDSGLNLKEYKHLGHSEQIRYTHSSLKSHQVVLQSIEPEQDVAVDEEGEQELLEEFYKLKPVKDGKMASQKREKNMHNLMIVRLEENGTVTTVREFNWVLWDGFHRIFISESENVASNANLLFQQTDYNHCLLYEWNKSANTYKYIKELLEFPTNVFGTHCFNTFISPDLKMYIDVNEMKVFDTIEGKPVAIIDDHVIANQGFKRAQVIANGFKWQSENQVVCVNAHEVERLFELMENPDKSSKYPMVFVEIGFCKLPYFKKKNLEKYHFYAERKATQKGNVQDSLRRHYQYFKRATLLHDPNQGDQTDLRLTRLRNIQDHCISIDTGHHKGGYQKRIQIKMSFNYMDWKVAEMIKNGELTIDQVDNKRLQQILLNIYPDCQTMLHYMASAPEQLNKIIKRLSVKKSGKVIDVPFIQDLNGKTLLHLFEKSSDSQNLNILLLELAKYGFDHHSRYIMDIQPQILAANLPNWVAYMDSRMFNTEYTEVITKGTMNLEQYTLYSQYVFSKTRVEEEVFKTSTYHDKKKAAQLEIQESNVEFKMIDIPYLHDFNENKAMDLMRELGSTPNFKFFDSEVIQTLIAYLFTPVRKWTLYKLFAPYLVLFACFMFVSHYSIPEYLRQSELQKANVGHDPAIEEELENQFMQFLMVSIPMVILAFYFLRIEMHQLMQNGVADYFSSMWSYVDLIPQVQILVITGMLYLGFTNLEVLTWLISICTFFIWAKFLSFMRIFKRFSYLLRMIVLVMIDMKYFLAVLLIGMVAFGDAFYVISRANPDTHFISSFPDSVLYVYNMSLGAYENDYGSVAPALGFSLFILCTLFNMIVMLNLLIAIISETFASVNENAEQARFQEQASLIAENNILLPESVKKSFYAKGSYLVRAVNIDKQLNNFEEDEQMECLTAIKENVLDLIKNVNQKLGEFEEEKKEEVEIDWDLPTSPNEIDIETDLVEIKKFHNHKMKWYNKDEACTNTGWSCDGAPHYAEGCMSGLNEFYKSGDFGMLGCLTCEVSFCAKCCKFQKFKEIHSEAEKKKAQLADSDNEADEFAL